MLIKRQCPFVQFKSKCLLVVYFPSLSLQALHPGLNGIFHFDEIFSGSPVIQDSAVIGIVGNSRLFVFKVMALFPHCVCVCVCVRVRVRVCCSATIILKNSA